MNLGKIIKYKVPLTIFSLVLITILIVIFLKLIEYSQNSNASLGEEQTSNSSNPTSSNVDFYKSYENDSIKVSETFPIQYGAYIDNYSHYEFTINKSIPVQLILVKSNEFISSEEMYKKMYMALSPTGNLVNTYIYIYKKKLVLKWLS